MTSTAPSTLGRAGKRAAMFLIAAAIGCLEGLILHSQFVEGQAEAVAAARLGLEQHAAEHGRLIESWVAAGLGNAEVLASFPTIRELTAAASGHRLSAAARQTLGRHASDIIASFVRVHRFRGGYVVGGDGEILASAGETLSPPLVRQFRARFATTATARLADILPSPSGPVVVFSVHVSTASGSEPFSHVLLVADPRDLLFSRFVRGAEPGDTGEALLLGSDGRRPVYLTPLRPVVPVPTHGFPTAHGWVRDNGMLQPISQVDYRGVEVVAASRAIAGTPWTLAMKIDRGEATRVIGNLRGVGWVTGAALVQVILVLALLRRRQAVHAREQREAAEQLRFLNSLYRTISEVNELMVREKDRQKLLDETCRIIVESAGFRMAWIGEARPDGHVVPVARAGEVQGYLDAIDIRTDDTPAGRGPTGRAIRERRTVLVDDIASDPAMSEWRGPALERGYRSAAAVPVAAGDRVLGVLKVYAGEPRWLRGEAIALIEKLAGNLAYSLDVVDLEARHLETRRALSASEEQLRQAQKMEAIGRLAGGIAHDFNNLLMVISGYADVALSAKAEERRRRGIEEIQTAAERASELTRQLVAFSRKQVLQPKVLDLNAVVARVESLLRRLIAENIEIVVSQAPDLASVLADPSQMEQVLMNLALNARDAMPDGGRIAIDTRNVTLHSGAPAAASELPPGDYVVVSVSDTGEGMPGEVLDHLFEPFFTTKEMGKGTGLGLSMVYGIVRQSGGAIGVESAVGRGSTFRVYMPATEALAAGPEQVASAPATGNGHESILIVEDNEAVRGFVTQTLRDAGYRVTDAGTPLSALAMLAPGGPSFDLLLTDIVLPEMDGYELARRASAARPSLRLLYMSGYTDNPKLREDALRTGIDLLEKPFGAPLLTAKVREVLERPRVAVDRPIPTD